MKRILIIAVLCISFFGAYSQNQADSVSLYQISTNDGNTFIGFILNETDKELELKTLIYGVIHIPKSIIVTRKNLTEKQVTKKQPVPIKIASDNESQLYNIITNDGFDFTGTIIKESDKEIEFKSTNYGDVTIQKLNIKTIHKIEENQIIDGDAWVENPQSSRYYFSPNGYALKKGEGYYQNIMVVVNQVSYGFSNYFTMGVGTIPIFLMGGDITPFWITPKFSLPVIKDKLNLGAGAFAGTILGEQTSFAMPYATITYGNKDKNISVSGGYLAADGEISDNPIISFSAMLRLSKRSYFISENYVFTSDDSFVLGSFGIRTVWTKSSLDYGFILPFGEDLFAFPWIGIVVPF